MFTFMGVSEPPLVPGLQVGHPDVVTADEGEQVGVTRTQLGVKARVLTRGLDFDRKSCYILQPNLREIQRKCTVARILALIPFLFHKPSKRKQFLEKYYQDG